MTADLLSESPSLASNDVRRRRMYRDAAALVGTAGLTAAVGLIFWAVAARLIEPTRLGIDTAIISLVTATASACAVGVGNAFTALLPVAGALLRQRLWQGYRLVLGAALVLGTLAAVVGAFTLAGPLATPVGMLSVVVAVVVWSLFVVQDAALTGMGQAIWLPWENVGVSLAKLAMLVSLVSATTHPATVATVVPAAVAVVVVTGFLVPLAARRRLNDTAVSLPPTGDDPAPGLLAASSAAVMRVFALRDGLASALSLGVLMLLPFVVTSVAGPQEGAVFGICLSLTIGLDLISAGMGVSLTVHAADRPEQARDIAFAVWRRLVLVVAAAALCLAALAPLILSFLGPTYVNSGGVVIIAVLALTSVVRTVFIIWASLQRALRHTGLLLALNTAVAATMLPLVIGLAHSFGAVGAATGVAVAQVLLSLVVCAHLRFTRSH